MPIRANVWASSFPNAIDAQLALEALEQALSSRDVKPGMIHHSDRGMQYAGQAYVQRLTEVGMHISMSGLGNPYDNAKAERFFRRSI